MMIHLGIQGSFRECLFQAVEKSVRIEGRLGIRPSQKLVQNGIRNMRLFASRHGWAPFHPSCPPTHEIPDSFEPNVAKIRRHHDLLFSWRRQVRRARPSPAADATSEEARDPVFVPVAIEGPVDRPAGPIISDPPSPTPIVPAPMIEIVMPAVTVRVPIGVDAVTLATVLATLRALA